MTEIAIAPGWEEIGRVLADMLKEANAACALKPHNSNLAALRRQIERMIAELKEPDEIPGAFPFEEED